MQLNIQGKRGAGRSKCTWLMNIREWTNLNTETAQDRQQIAGIVSILKMGY